MVKWNGPFRSDRSNREKRSTSKGGPLFSKLFLLDRTDPFSLRSKFPEILVEWIAPTVSYQVTKLFSVTDVFSPKNSQAWGRVTWQGNVLNSADFMASYKFIPFLICLLVVSSSSLPFATSSGLNGFWYRYYFEVISRKTKLKKNQG